MTPRDLRAQLEAMPAGALIPAAWVAEQLATLAPEAIPETAEVLDVAALARRWKRSPSAVRALLEAGAIPAAWKQGGRAWRVRRADVEDHETTQADRTRPDAGPINLRAIARGTRRAG